jgi:hypothetical protein
MTEDGEQTTEGNKRAVEITLCTEKCIEMKNQK